MELVGADWVGQTCAAIKPSCIIMYQYISLAGGKTAFLTRGSSHMNNVLVGSDGSSFIIHFVSTKLMSIREMLGLKAADPTLALSKVYDDSVANGRWSSPL